MWPNLERGVQNRRYAKIEIKLQKGTQKGPKGPQKGPKGAQEGPEGAQKVTKGAQKGSKTTPKGTLEPPNRVPNDWKPYFLDFDAGLERNRYSWNPPATPPGKHRTNPSPNPFPLT